MKTYQNEHLTIRVDCGVHLLTQKWYGLPSSTSFQKGSRVSLGLAQRHQIKRWLVDLQELRLFNPTDLQWFIQQWLSKADQKVPQAIRLAIVISDINQFGKQGSDLIFRALDVFNPAINCRYCLNQAEARQWLLQHN